MSIEISCDPDGQYRLCSPAFELRARIGPLIINGKPGPALCLRNTGQCDGELGGVQGTIRREVSSPDDGSRPDAMVVTTEWFAAKDSELVGLRLSVRNTGDRPFHLNSITPLLVEEDDAIRVGGAGMQDWRVLRMARQKNDIPGCFRPAYEDADLRGALFSSAEIAAGHGVADAEHAEMETRTVTADACAVIRNDREESGPGLFLGMLGQTDHLATTRFRVSADRTFLERLEVEAEFDDVLVEPGEERTTHWLVVSEATDEYAALQRYAGWLGEEYQVPPPLTPPPSIYCSWYFYGGELTQDDLDENLESLASRPTPFDVLLIDDGWNDGFGTWHPNEKWPHGMAHAAERIREAGYEPGIWTCPFVLMADSPILDQYPDLVARDADGDPCRFPYQGPACYALDPTSPSAAAYFCELYTRLRDWGFRYHKFDFLRAVPNAPNVRFHDPKATRAQAYRRGLELIRQAVGPDAYLLACGGLYEGSIGLADGQRSGADVVGDWTREHHAVGGSHLLMTIKQNVMRSFMNRLWHTDADAMMLRRRAEPLRDIGRMAGNCLGRLTDEEAFSAVVNQYLGGGLVCLSERFAELDEDRHALLRHVIPAAAPPARPLNIARPVCPDLFLTQVSPRCPEAGIWWTLAAANWEDESITRQLDLGRVPFPDSVSHVAAFEFRTQQFYGIRSRRDVIELELPAHGTRVLRLAPWDGERPVLLGTDLHLTGGGCELTDLRFEPRSVCGRVETSWEYPVRVTVAFPGDPAPEVVSRTIPSGQSEFEIRSGSYF